MERIKIICVVGATASGKTALGVEIAKRINAEIISADSMQVYKDMPVATAAASEEERQGVPHHLLEFLDTEQTFSVADFVKLAKKKCFEIHSRGRVPMLVGGTGLFIDSLVNNLVFSDVGVNSELRRKLEEKSADELYDELCRLDPNAAEAIHKNNKKRVIRALELCYGGSSKTDQNINSRSEESPFEALYIGIDYKNRQALYDRINLRAEKMLEHGLEDEARRMLDKAGVTSRQAIGHKEFAPYIAGEITKEEALESLKRETRRYAKRQLTWFRRNENIIWFYADELPEKELTESACRAAEEFLGIHN